ncbi:MAG: PIN domain-containing protein [Thermoplasmata archaeon]|nr:PIN domain-containing protein [Thermoplasmata archaeon]
MHVADTSALYALFSKNDIHHKKAVDAFKKPETILIPLEIWSETLSLIQYRQDYETARTAGEYLLKLPHVDLEIPTRQMIMDTWRQYNKAHGRLSYPDAAVVVCCLNKNLTPISFDKKINKYV